MVAVEPRGKDALSELSHHERLAVPGLRDFDTTKDFNDLGDRAGKRSANEGVLKQHLRDQEGGAGALGLPNDSGGAPATGNQSLAKRINSILWGNKKRKAGTIGSGIGVTGLVGIITLLSISSGPLQFAQIAQLLTHAHFGHISAASDTRLGKMMYKAVASKNLGELDFGNTRLGIFFNTPAHKAKILADLKSKGIEPEFGKLKSFKGFTVDTTNPGSDFFGKDKEGAIKSLEERMGMKPGSIKPESVVWDEGRLTIKSSYFKQSSLIKGMVRLSGKSWLVTAWRARTLKLYTMASNFHPFKKLDLKIKEKTLDVAAALKEWAGERTQRLKSGISASSVDTTKAKEQTTDADGNVIDKPIEGGEKTTVTSEKLSATIKGLKVGAGVAGGLAAAAGVVIMFRALNDSIGIMQYVQVSLPMARMATDLLSMNSQMQSGQTDTSGKNNADLMREMGYFAQHTFVSRDSKTHQVTSSWSDAATMRSAMGQSGGIDVSQPVKDAFAGPPSWLAWTHSAPVDALYSGVGQAVTGVVSVVVGVVSGGVVSTAVGMAVSMLALPRVMDFVVGMLAGTAVDVNASGADWGNYLNYGARLAANAESLQFGGVKQSDKQVAELDAQQQANEKAQLASMSLTDRIFNVYDYRSLSGSAIAQLNLAGGSQALLAKIGNAPTAFFSAIFSLPMNILMPRAHAAATTYKYPFPEYGFSIEDQDNPLVQDPAANAKAVSELLDSKDGEQYISKALDCFGVAISKSDGLWDAVPSTSAASDGQDRTYGVNAYDASSYNPSDCLSPSGLNRNSWLRVRFWIFDTAVMEGYACYLGDATSCANSGF